jgi:hypothetical protein
MTLILTSFCLAPLLTELTPELATLRSKLQQLTLNSTAIWEKELAYGPIQAPWLIKAPYLILCWFLDSVFEGKYVFSRFFFLETVARMPYFSYITMLHLYETLGFWRRSADIKRIHFAEEINEFRHLLIMEVCPTCACSRMLESLSLTCNCFLSLVTWRRSTMVGAVLGTTFCHSVFRCLVYSLGSFPKPLIQVF